MLENSGCEPAFFLGLCCLTCMGQPDPGSASTMSISSRPSKHVQVAKWRRANAGCLQLKGVLSSLAVISRMLFCIYMFQLSVSGSCHYTLFHVSILAGVLASILREAHQEVISAASDLYRNMTAWWPPIGIYYLSLVCHSWHYIYIYIYFFLFFCTRLHTCLTFWEVHVGRRVIGPILTEQSVLSTLHFGQLHKLVEIGHAGLGSQSIYLRAVLAV